MSDDAPGSSDTAALVDLLKGVDFTKPVSRGDLIRFFMPFHEAMFWQVNLLEVTAAHVPTVPREMLMTALEQHKEVSQNLKDTLKRWQEDDASGE